MAVGAFLNFGYNVFKDLAAVLRGRRGRLSPEQRFEYQQKWKPIFEEELWKCRSQNLRQDVIIHDVKKHQFYPDMPEGKGISPWFKAYLVGIYHKGIEVSLGISELTNSAEFGGWHHTEDLSQEYVNAHLIGYIPYEQIAYAEMDGDEFYSYPHIYCHFDLKGCPYERLRYCVEKKTPSSIWYEPIASKDGVWRASLKAGTRPIGGE